jgi:hypothetical protein
MNAPSSQNAQIAARLREAGDLLRAQGANPFRADAYHRAADTVAEFGGSLSEEFDKRGVSGLQRLPGIGVGIANAIAEMLITGHWNQLARLRGESDEAASHAGIELPEAPPVELLLDVDREYRAKAAAGRLTLIAPKRHNPEGKAWLPVLHTRHGDWHFTALFSNTARAHELGRSRDWVVIFFYDGDHREHQCTVVTENRGELAGQRVVRGREAECARLFDSLEMSAG